MSCEERSKSLIFRRGHLIGSKSNDTAERLGHLLLSRGIITADELAQAIITSAERGDRLGDILVTEGIVPTSTLLEGLRAQLEARVIDLLGWRHGWYAVHEGHDDSLEISLEGVDPLDLVARALRVHWDEATLGQLFEGHMERTLNQPDEETTASPRLPLTPKESRLAQALKPGRSIEEIVDGLNPEDRTATLRLLLWRQRIGHTTLISAD